MRGPGLQFGTPATVVIRLLLSHICVSDHAGGNNLVGSVSDAIGGLDKVDHVAIYLNPGLAGEAICSANAAPKR